DNDLNDKIGFFVKKAQDSPTARVFVYGSAWPDDPTHPGGQDKIFHFHPDQGIHDVHMNQGNPAGTFKKDNGVYNDGALVFHYPAEDRWVAVFLAFQSQAWHTDDVTGDALTGPGPVPNPDEPDLQVRIVAAVVNPAGADAGKETVTVINATPADIPLAGWS